MKHFAWILGSGAVAAGMLWSTSLFGRTVAADAGGRVGGEAPEGVAALAPLAAADAVPRADPVVELRGELRAVIGLPEAAEREIVLLQALVAIGTNSAIAAAVEAVQDPRSTLYDAPERTEAVFRAVRGEPRVAHFAHDALDAALSRTAGEGTADREVLGPYHLLFARNARHAGLTLLEHLRAGSGPLRASAAVAVAQLADHDLGADFLGLVTAGGDLGEEVVGGLASSLVAWGDPEVTDELYRAVLGAGLPGESRAAILGALGRALDDEHLPLVLALYTAERDPAVRRALRRALRSVGEAELLSVDALLAHLEPVLLSWLGSADADEARDGCALVAEVPPLRTDAVREALESLRPGAEPELTPLVDEALRACEAE